MLICAHRGDRRRFEDNTIEAFRSALALGADMIEFDVHVSADGIAVINHDAMLSGGQRIRETSLRELRDAKPGLLTVEELFEEFAGRALFDMEFKDLGAVEIGAGIARRHRLDEALWVSSFYPAMLARWRAHSSRGRCGLLLDRGPIDESRWRRLGALSSSGLLDAVIWPVDTYAPSLKSIIRADV